MTSAILGSSLINTVLGMAATFLALAVGVQVLQEMWKYLFSTQAGVYSRVLQDVLGSWAQQLVQSPALADLHVRGPFQWRRIRPTGKLLPLNRADLIDGLERTATIWRQRGLDALRVEARVQAGTATPPSVNWLAFMEELVHADPGGPNEPGRKELLQFFGGIGISATGGNAAPFDAQRGLTLYRDRFFPRVVQVEQRFDRLQEVFTYQYRRRNLVLTFVLSVIVAVALGLPTQTIYRRAKAMSPQETAALVANAQTLYQRADSMARIASTVPDRGQTQGDTAVTAAVQEAARELAATAAALHTELTPVALNAPWKTLPGWSQIEALWQRKDGGLLALLWYILGCALTAVMICFGAPFWNDIVTALASRVRPAESPPPQREAVNA